MCNEKTKMEFETKLINLVDHPVHIKRPDGLIITIKPSGIVARVVTNGYPSDFKINGIPCGFENLTPIIEGLPEPKENTYYIVSKIVLHMCSDRLDLVAPDTSTVMKKKDKRIIKKLILNGRAKWLFQKK